MDNLDPEINAMSQAAKAISDLEDEAAKSRVIKWLSEKFTTPRIIDKFETPAEEIHSGKISSFDDIKFKDFADLFDCVNPSTFVYKIIIAGYWLQIINNSDSWSSLEVNNLLKNMGQGLLNINHKMETAQNTKPAAFIRQLMKKGKTKQAKKTYRLTEAGISAVKQMIESSSGKTLTPQNG